MKLDTLREWPIHSAIIAHASQLFVLNFWLSAGYDMCWRMPWHHNYLAFKIVLVLFSTAIKLLEPRKHRLDVWLRSQYFSTLGTLGLIYIRALNIISHSFWASFISFTVEIWDFLGGRRVISVYMYEIAYCEGVTSTRSWIIQIKTGQEILKLNDTGHSKSSTLVTRLREITFIVNFMKL